ncbi:uncharacterized protein LOC124658307 isoform X2 [Lolium rigidum]|uniref:uncharacterized protein LOC124658307 isoform X2 n=1 Tax=Lolium rigidum TaxID=89674 RepID=UPI001F5C3EDA|nr:uncharacterized protein LOC124658307 isoform X2 [Lolium rigidum]
MCCRLVATFWSRRGTDTLRRPGEEGGVGDGACWPGGAGCHLRGSQEFMKLPLSYDPHPAPYPSLYEFNQMLSVPSVHRAGAPGPLLRTQIERHSATQQIAAKDLCENLLSTSMELQIVHPD